MGVVVSGSFQDRVRQELVKEGGNEIAATELARRLGLAPGKQIKRLYNVLTDLAKAGGCERARKGVYRAVRKAGPPALNQVMWRLLRARRVVSVEDLQELAGASEGYALEWLDMLQRHGVVRNLVTAHKLRGKYQLVKDSLDMPQDGQKSARLKRARLAKREALAALTAATLAVRRAEEFVREIDFEEEVQGG